MATFISLRSGSDEMLLNLDNIVSITHESGSKDIKIRSVGDKDPAVYTDVDIDDIKKLVNIL